MAEDSHPLLGHARILLMDGDAEEIQRKLLADDRGDLGRSGHWIGRKPWLSVTRWQDARAILNSVSTREGNPVARRAIFQLMPKSILLLNGKEWKHNRAAINKSFTPAELNASTDAMVKVTERVCQTFKERILKDGNYKGKIEPLMKMITFDVFGAATFSEDFGCTNNLRPHVFAAAFDSLDSDFKKSKQTIQHYVEHIIKERKDRIRKSDDLLSSIIDTNIKNDTGSADDVVRDVVTTVLFAGYDTTSVTLTFALYMLNKYPTITEKCVEEISSVKSLRDYGELTYCRAVVTETLRLFPPATQTSRCLNKDFKFQDGFELPQGTNVLIPIISIHHDEKNFDRPLEFLPERWVRQEDVDGGDGIKVRRWVERDPGNEADASSKTVKAANLKAFFAFSGGGRNCPGMKFAWKEAVIVLAGLLRDFQFETIDPDYVMHAERGGGLIQHPRDGLPMKVVLRSGGTKEC